MTDKPMTRADKIAWLEDELSPAIGHLWAERIVDHLTPSVPTRFAIVHAICRGSREGTCLNDETRVMVHGAEADRVLVLLAEHGIHEQEKK